MLLEKLKNDKRIRRLLILSVVALLIIGLTLGSVYLFCYRYDIVYGFRDSLRKGDDGLLTVYGTDTRDIQINTLESGTTEGVTFTNQLILVNNHYLINEDTELNLADYGDGTNRMSELAVLPFDTLINDAYEYFADEIFITSSYRDAAQQAAILADSPDVAAQVGSSEHQTGLAIDIAVDLYRSRRFVMCDTGKWVNENCDEYGFIIRYPFWGKSLTEITYEPWHLRYVGLPHSQIITDSKITLEQYSDLFEEGEFYIYDTVYVISYQIPDESGNIEIPVDDDVTVSPDNTGGYFVWCTI